MKVNEYVTEFEKRINEATTPVDIVKAEQELRVETWNDGSLSLVEKEEVFDKLNTMYMTAIFWKPTEMVKAFQENTTVESIIENMN